jgi:hypothetical protein
MGMVTSVAGGPSGAAAPMEQFSAVTASRLKIASGNGAAAQGRRRRYALAAERSDFRYFFIFCGKRLPHGAGRQDHVCQCRFCLWPRARFQTAVRVDP